MSDPEDDKPLCPWCSGDVDLDTDGWAKGLYRCRSEKCGAYSTFSELSWRA